MSYRQNRELARIRSELRMRLMSRRYDDTSSVLGRLREVAESSVLGSDELRSEYERWRLRFEMLGATQTATAA